MRTQYIQAHVSLFGHAVLLRGVVRCIAEAGVDGPAEYEAELSSACCADSPTIELDLDGYAIKIKEKYEPLIEWCESQLIANL